MSVDLSSLEVHIRSILTSPNTDMSLISARGVRQKLVKLVPGFTAEYAREHKHDLDTIITRVYREVCGEDDEEADEEAASVEGAEKTRKRKQESDEDNADEDDEAEDRVDKQSVKKAKKDAEEDEGGKAKVRKGGRASANGTAKKVGRPKKSAATVESEAESEEEGSKKKRAKKKTTTGEGGGARGGFAKEFPLSEPLAKVVNAEKLSRPQVVKKLWIYIKEKGLQNPQNGKEILLDDNLKAVFGGEKIDMFAMNKALGKHLQKD